MALRISEAEYEALVSSGRLRPVDQPKTFAHPRAGKSTAGKRADLGGQRVRSAWEANYARYLNWAGISWEYEPRIFTFPIKRGVTEYRPDFYLPGRKEWHEVKGWLDPRSKTALKRFAKYYPDEKLVLVTKTFFAGLHKRGIPQLIPGWEYSKKEDA